MTVTRIINRAAIDLREKPISSLEDGTPVANAFARVIDESIDDVLMEYEWSCAWYRAELSQSPQAGILYDHVFMWPSDPYCLKIRKVVEPLERWKLRGRFIEADADKVVIEYTRRLVNENEISPWVIPAIAKMVAARACPLISADPGLMQRVSAEYQIALLQAKKNEAEMLPDEPDAELWDSRMEA